MTLRYGMNTGQGNGYSIRLILRAGRCLLLSAAILTAAPLAAWAQTSAITRFDSWELICEPAPRTADPSSPQAPKPGAAGDKPTTPRAACKVTQKLAVKDTGEAVFLISVLPAAQAGQLVAIISTPLGGYLTPGMELRLDGKKPVRVLFETCNAAGCHGGFALAGRIRTDLAAARQMQVRLWTSKSKPVDVSVSLDGFGKAVKALEGAVNP